MPVKWYVWIKLLWFAWAAVTTNGHHPCIGKVKVRKQLAMFGHLMWSPVLFLVQANCQNNLQVCTRDSTVLVYRRISWTYRLQNWMWDLPLAHDRSRRKWLKLNWSHPMLRVHSPVKTLKCASQRLWIFASLSLKSANFSFRILSCVRVDSASKICLLTITNISAYLCNICIWLKIIRKTC